MSGVNDVKIRVVFVVLCILVLLSACVREGVNQEVVENYWKAFQETAQEDILHYTITYTIEQGDEDIVLESMIWSGMEGYLVEIRQNGNIYSRNVCYNDEIYQYTALTDSWTNDDARDDIDPFEDILAIHNGADLDSLIWAESDDGYEVTINYPPFTDADTDAVKFNAVTMYFSGDWVLNGFTVVPELHDDYLRENGNGGTVTTKVEILSRNSEEIQSVIADAYQSATEK